MAVKDSNPSPNEKNTKTFEFNQRIKSNLSGEAAKITSAQLAKKFEITTNDFIAKLVKNNFLEMNGNSHSLTVKGKEAGGEKRTSPRYGIFFIWPETLKL